MQPCDSVIGLKAGSYMVGVISLTASRWLQLAPGLICRSWSIPSSILLGGCASTQLNYNTQDIAASVSDVYLEQVLDNFGLFISNRYAVPSQVDMLAGTVQTSNTITPSITIPLTNMVASTIGAMISNTHTFAGKSFSVMAGNTGQQNWNITTISDAMALRNLRALYRYVIVPGVSDAQLIGKDGKDGEYTVPRHYDYSVNITADPFFLLPPQCVICIQEEKITDPKSPRFINEDLKVTEETVWLFWKNADGTFSSKYHQNNPFPPLPADTPKMKYLGRHAGFELYIQEKDLDRLYRFLLFTLPVSEPVPPAGAKPVEVVAVSPPKPPGKPAVRPPAPLPPAGLGGGPAANPRGITPFFLPTPLGIQPQPQ
jgi:hypothetical protein